MFVLITGGAGFIGSHVTELLKFRDMADVLVLDNLSTGNVKNLDKSIRVVEKDIINWNDVDHIFDQFHPDVVVHLAAQPAISTSWKFPDADARANVMGTLNICRACDEYKVKRLIFASTSAVYDDQTSIPLQECDDLKPNSPYGVSKLAAESYVRLIHPDSVVLRFGNVYGPKQVPLGENQVIPRLIRHMEGKGNFVIHGDGKQKRDFVYVGDVAAAVSAAISGMAWTYNIASGTETSINLLVDMITMLYKCDMMVFINTEENDPRRNSRMDISKAKTGLNWEPKMSLIDGLKITIDWWQQQKNDD